jgi:hypothetical protein
MRPKREDANSYAFILGSVHNVDTLSVRKAALVRALWTDAGYNKPGS